MARGTRTTGTQVLWPWSQVPSAQDKARSERCPQGSHSRGFDTQIPLVEDGSLRQQ
jgi:hypothetical protein